MNPESNVAQHPCAWKHQEVHTCKGCVSEEKQGEHRHSGMCELPSITLCCCALATALAATLTPSPTEETDGLCLSRVERRGEGGNNAPGLTECPVSLPFSDCPREHGVGNYPEA